MANMAVVGKKNKANGAIFEQIISSSCNYYLDEEIAFIEKTPEPFRITSKSQNGVVSGFYAKAGQPDYKGILFGGMGVMFEAKHTDTPQIKQSAVTENQAKNLDIYHKFGALCFVLVSMGFESFYRVPWEVWKHMKELFGHKSMSLEELAPYEVKMKGLVIQFLDNIEDIKIKDKEVLELLKQKEKKKKKGEEEDEG